MISPCHGNLPEDSWSEGQGSGLRASALVLGFRVLGLRGGDPTSPRTST